MFFFEKKNQKTFTLGRRTLVLGLITTPAFAAHHHHKAPTPVPTTPTPDTSDEDSGPDAATSTASPAFTPLGPVDTVAQQACIVDFNTGATLMDKQADTPMVPSSLTKLMTAYIVFTALNEGKLTLTQQLPVSEKAWHMGGSKMFVPYPGNVTVEDLIRGMITQSGNDACIVLAEGLSGSEQQFVDRMNDMATKLGMTHATFRNATGWPDPDHRMSPRDIAILAKHLIADFPQYYHYFSEKDYTYNGIHQGNRNTLVDHGIADGLKTGHTEEGGYGECSSAERNGRRVIVVLNGMSSKNERAHETERLLDWAFASFENVQLLTEGEPLDRIPVWMGTAPDVQMLGGQTLLTTLPRGWKANTKVEVEYATPVRAPIRQGDQLGSMKITNGANQPILLPLLAATDVPRIGLAERALRVLSGYTHHAA